MLKSEVIYFVECDHKDCINRIQYPEGTATSRNNVIEIAGWQTILDNRDIDDYNSAKHFCRKHQLKLDKDGGGA